jgi:hypothetical protein
MTRNYFASDDDSPHVARYRERVHEHVRESSPRAEEFGEWSRRQREAELAKPLLHSKLPDAAAPWKMAKPVVRAAPSRSGTLTWVLASPFYRVRAGTLTLETALESGAWNVALFLMYGEAADQGFVELAQITAPGVTTYAIADERGVVWLAVPKVLSGIVTYKFGGDAITRN